MALTDEPRGLSQALQPCSVDRQLVTAAITRTFLTTSDFFNRSSKSIIMTRDTHIRRTVALTVAVGSHQLTVAVGSYQQQQQQQQQLSSPAQPLSRFLMQHFASIKTASCDRLMRMRSVLRICCSFGLSF